MNVSSFIAKRYFFAKKSRNFIQVLSIVSMVGVAIGTMALILVLSVFNGLQGVMEEVYSTFDPDLKVQPTAGKTFNIEQETLETINEIEGVKAYAPVLEENIVLSFQETQSVVRLKGVGSKFLEMNKLDTFLVLGELKFEEQNRDFALLGIGVAHNLKVLREGDFNLQAIFPKKVKAGAMLSADALSKRNISPAGIFQIEANYDEKYVISSLGFAQRLTGYKNRFTSLEIYTQSKGDVNSVKRKVQEILGADFEILNSQEQHAELLRAIKIEKLFIYVALSFITAIASFNIFFCLSMLAIEKRKDISVMISMGAPPKLIKGIFLKQGAYIALVGTVVGIVLGITLCILQQKYGLVGMGMSTSIIQAYPVELQFTDTLMVTLAMVLITFATSYRPALLASKTDHKKHLG